MSGIAAAGRRTLLTVSGKIDRSAAAEIEAGRRPRADYRAMAEVFPAELMDVEAARRLGGRFARLAARWAGDGALLAVACWRRRRRYDVIFSDGEQVGMPYAALAWFGRHRPYHVMIGHVLSPRKKVLLHRVLHLGRRIDVVVVYAEAQRRVAIDVLGYPPERVLLSTFMVDAEFWRPDAVPAVIGDRPLICAVGLERRDYPTMIEAVRDVDVDVVVAASSPWSRRANSSAGMAIPANVTVRSFVPYDLRQLYADAAFVVVPLEATDFQAGITTILEAMAMGRAVICSRTPGQTDTIVDGVTGLYVTPGDPTELRSAIERLRADPALAHQLGTAGREWVLAHARIEDYAERLGALLPVLTAPSLLS